MLLCPCGMLLFAKTKYLEKTSAMLEPRPLGSLNAPRPLPREWKRLLPTNSTAKPDQDTMRKPTHTEPLSSFSAWNMPSFMYNATEDAKKDRKCASGINQLENLPEFRAKLSTAGGTDEGSATQRQRKIVHLTMYDCELSMLELKLAEMGPIVFKFVIGEALMSNANRPRQACFHDALSKSRIIQYYMNVGKIEYLFMDNQLNEGQFVYWEAEVHYKNQLSGPLLKMKNELADDDLILFLDLDEIVGAPYLRFMSENLTHVPDGGGIRLALRWTYYGFQWVNPDLTVINAVVTWGDLKGRCGMKANAIRLNLCGGETNRVAWGVVGWHCSWCIPTPQFLEKLDKTSATEMNVPLNRNLDFLTSQRNAGLWFMTQTPNACFAEFDKADSSFLPALADFSIVKEH
jgi:hypothetical protein